jgi:DNA-binding beta-propeller fold protein YncE
LKKIFFSICISLNALAQPINFDAKGILYLEDGDFGPFSYSTRLIDRLGSDKMGAFLFPLQFEDTFKNTEQIISNSVLNGSRTIALKSDNRMCYVLESKGGLKKDEKQVQFTGLPDGAYVSVVDISNLRNIKPDYRFPVALNPRAIALNSSNEYLAVAAEGYNQELQVFELNEFGKPIRIIPKPSTLGIGVINDVIWHPNEDFIVYLKEDTKEIGMLKVIKDGPTQKIIRLEQFGSTVKFDGFPILGAFTPDGKYFLVLDAKDQIGINSPKGQVFVIKFKENEPHALISKEDVEENPKSLVLHPDGNTILVANLKKSFEYPINDRNTGKSSISILSLGKDGSLVNKGNISLSGIMPLSVVFDKTGNNFAVSVFQYLNFGKSFGGIEFYKFLGGQYPRIEKQNAIINTPSGIHYLKVIGDY